MILQFMQKKTFIETLQILMTRIKVYDFVVDYEQIGGVKAIYDMHRYLMTKHNISP